MRLSTLSPRLHLFVCANRRSSDSPLGSGCSDFGDAVFAQLKDEVARRSRIADVWVTKTHCLGICPVAGATVAIYPAGRILTEVQADDARELYDRIAEETS
jgi:(2Fe-2S) ferredoxin